MSTHAISLIDFQRRDTLRGTLLVSVILHAVLFGVLVTYTTARISPGRRGPGVGHAGRNSAWERCRGLPGVPLPSPLLSTPTAVATENTGLYKTEPQPKEVPPPDAQPIPKFKDAVKPEKLERVNKRIQKAEVIPPPPNAVPYGQTGPPTMSYTQMATSAGTGGVADGPGNSFGQRYAWYVASMRSRISANWLLATVSPSIATAPRAYLTFEIARDGSISNAQITQSSGIPEVDRSALRAILASNPLPALPPDYNGGSVHVEFYFDFHKQ